MGLRNYQFFNQKYRLEVIENRNADTLEDFIRKFIFK